MAESTILGPRFQDALTLGAELHANQRRKVSGVPYMGHLLRVAGIVLEYGGSEDDAIAALLHDAVEDQGGPAAGDEIRRRFGHEVLAIVEQCSDTDQSPKPPWRQRKEAFLRRLASLSASARLVLAADKLDNIRSLTAAYRQEGEEIWRKFGGGRDGTLWYYREVVEGLKSHEPCPLVDELERSLTQLTTILQQ